MGRRRRDHDVQAAIAAIEASTLAAMADPTEAQRQAVRRYAELRHLADRARQAALRGSAVNVADILRLEEAAQAGLAALPTAQVRRIEVELIESRFENQADPESE